LNDPPEELVYDRGLLKTIDVAEARLARQLDHHVLARQDDCTVAEPISQRFEVLDDAGLLGVEALGITTMREVTALARGDRAQARRRGRHPCDGPGIKKAPSSGARALGITLLSVQYTELGFRK
jgi:hypothetical protein